MLIKNLELTNFRNYSSCRFEYSDGVNVVSGGNAQGKTNSAEAIFFLCTGYSPRAVREKQVIKHGESFAKIKGVASSNYGDVSVSIDFFVDKNKIIKVNEVPVGKIGELLGNINSVFFNPGELKLIQEAPEDRRRFLDVALSQISRGYFYALQTYKKILAQRNNLLKNEDRALIFDTLPVWDQSLARAGARIIFERNEYIKMLSPFAGFCHEEVTGGGENLTVKGDYKYEGTEDDIYSQFLSALTERTEKDIETGYTTVGPHRDDLKIKVNGIDVRAYGSQGQQRTASIALKLAETEIFREKFGEYPVLILDDAMSELDKKRRTRLIDYVKKMQTIITCTEPECVPNYQNYNNIEVENGNIL
ncbi:MAG: DNA replication/repair protein RecF [Clostridia bacterium]|nr:DNA replication/repair protein RecF [Clostridia bacterium]